MPPRLSAAARATRPTAMQELLGRATDPGVVSFALGLPAGDLFPAAAYARALARVLEADPLALQYSPPHAPLRARVVALMALRGVACREEQVFLTAGAQQGLSLLARLFLDRAAPVVVEEQVFPGVRQVLEPYEPDLRTVPTDLRDGIDVDAVAAQLAREPRPAFIYAMSDGHNPLGLSLTMETRRRLVALARAHRVPIVEDDPYGLLAYTDRPLPALRALDDEWVCYVGSFSKILAPGVRVGWIVAPEPVIDALAMLKEAADINTATLTQRAVAAWLDDGSLPEHLAALRREYRRRRDAMLEALARHFAAAWEWTEPAHGLFVWAESREPLDTDALLRVALETERVAFVPGHAFCLRPGRGRGPALRLNFSHCAVDVIAEGMARLRRAWARVASRAG